MTSTYEDDIAIIGMSGLFAKAPDKDVFWQNILNKVDAVSEAPPEWIGDARMLNSERNELRYIYTNHGGFLGDLSRFDPREFGTMPVSVEGGQPDQFLALKLASDALTDAGYAPGTFDGKTTGVILGHAVHAHRANVNGIQQISLSWQVRELLRTIFPDTSEDRLDAAVDMLEAGMPQISADTMPGLVPNIMTGRIANRLDLMGPNYIIDAACASSLIVVDLAISELRSGRADMMLAGGVNTTTSPLVYSVFCSVGALSRQSKIRPFDSSSDGTILGEGAGILVLKRLSDALKAGDRIYATVKGVGLSSDGKGAGLMAPRLEGEMLAMERAFRQARIDPQSIGLIEAHGTGIPLGDRTEIDALRQIFGGRRRNYPDVPIGSVKSMIGHCIPAAGAASMIKCALALYHKVVPPTLCDDVNGDIGIEGTPFYVATEAQPWIHGGPDPRRAAINAFGFGGVNAQLIMEEAPNNSRVSYPAAAFPIADDQTNRVFGFAAADRTALLETIRRFRTDVVDAPSFDLDEAMAQCWSGVHDGPHRLAIVAATASDLSRKLDKALEQLTDSKLDRVATRSGIYYAKEPLKGQVAFMFPGEMAQYPGMMRDAAMVFPEAREWFDFMDALFAGQRDERHSHLIFQPSTCLDGECKDALDRKLHQVDFGSESVFAADQAMLAAISKLGIKADCFVGHSTGENAAFVGSGILDMSREEIGALIKRMNSVFEEVDRSGKVPSGVLLNVAAFEPDKLRLTLDRHPQVHFTMDNCPNQAIVFGRDEAIDKLEQELISEGAVCTRLPISWGYHTEHVRPMASSFARLFSDMRISDSEIRLYSCATAAPFPTNDVESFRKTAIAQYVSPVRFTETIERMYADGCRIFVEVGPNNLLTSFVKDILRDRPHVAVASDNPKRGTLAQLNHLVAQVFVAGVVVDPKVLIAPPRSKRDHARAPRLASELPFIRLDQDEARKLRAMFDVGTAIDGKAPKPADEHANGAARPAASVSFDRPTPGKTTQATMRGHFSLMSEFLQQQERMTHAAFARRRQINGDAFCVSELTSLFDVPFPMSAILLAGDVDLKSSRSRFTADELRLTDRDDGASRSGWLKQRILGRLAAKCATRDLIKRQFGRELADQNVVITTDERGRPLVHIAGQSLPKLHISLSHIEGMAVGVACFADWDVGIDIDLAARIQHPADFISSVLLREEVELLNNELQTANRDVAVHAWCIKEAAAKAIGTGLNGNPKEFCISELSSKGSRAKVSVAGYSIDVLLTKINAATCALAYHSTIT